MRPRIWRLLLVLSATVALASPAAGADQQVDQAVKALRSDSSLKVRAQAALILGQRRAREAVEALSEALERDEAPAVRIAAATALGRIGDPSARPALESAQRNDPVVHVRQAASRAVEMLTTGTVRRKAVALEETQGKGSDSARNALSDALARYLAIRGFSVLPAGSDAPYRIKPSVLALEVEDGDGRVIIAAKAAVIAVASDGRMELLQGSARLKASGGSREKLAARALEAVAKDLAEDLDAKLR
jgi:HEAT repeat protein